VFFPEEKTFSINRFLTVKPQVKVIKNNSLSGFTCLF